VETTAGPTVGIDILGLDQDPKAILKAAKKIRKQVIRGSLTGPTWGRRSPESADKRGHLAVQMEVEARWQMNHRAHTRQRTGDLGQSWGCPSALDWLRRGRWRMPWNRTWAIGGGAPRQHRRGRPCRRARASAGQLAAGAWRRRPRLRGPFEQACLGVLGPAPGVPVGVASAGMAPASSGFPSDSACSWWSAQDVATASSLSNVPTSPS
jgi:hypothetical protein